MLSKKQQCFMAATNKLTNASMSYAQAVRDYRLMHDNIKTQTVNLKDEWIDDWPQVKPLVKQIEAQLLELGRAAIEFAAAAAAAKD